MSVRVPLMIPRTKKKYSYEDIGEVDEIDSNDESIEECSLEDDCSQYSRSDCGSRREWLSTIAEETSFDLRTRQTRDSLSLASYFDHSLATDDDDDEEEEEEMNSLRSVERKIEALRQRLERFGGMSEEESLDSDCVDYYSDEELKDLDPPPMQRQKSNPSLMSPPSTDKDLRTTSQSTQTTSENSSSSHSSAFDKSRNDDDDVPDFACDINESERIDPASMSSSMKDTQVQLGSSPLPKMNGISSSSNKAKTSSSQHKWIGFNIEFAVPTTDTPADSVSLLDVSVYVDNSITSTTSLIELRDASNNLNIPTSIREESRILDCDLETPLVSPKPKVVIPDLISFTLHQLEKDSPTCKLNEEASPRSLHTPHELDASMVVTKTTLLQHPCTPVPVPVAYHITETIPVQSPPLMQTTIRPIMQLSVPTVAYHHFQSPGYSRREHKRSSIQARLQVLQYVLSTLVPEEEETNTKVLAEC